MIGAGRSNTCRIPWWPRVISSWCDIVWWPVPMEPTSRPEDQDLPSPRQITARTSGRSFSSPRISKSRPSIASSKALCFSTLSFVIVAIGPSMSSRTRASGGLDIGGNVGRNERTFKGEEPVCPT
jgi:hypothetical protein